MDRATTSVDGAKVYMDYGFYKTLINEDVKAKFDQSYLYNSSVTQLFQNSNTNSSRGGKFGCSWASDRKVSIQSNSHWSSEKISI